MKDIIHALLTLIQVVAADPVVSEVPADRLHRELQRHRRREAPSPPLRPVWANLRWLQGASGTAT